jgi:hypothetical protein
LPTSRSLTCLLSSVVSLAIALPINRVTAQVPEPVLTRFTYAVIIGQDTVWQYIVRSPAHFQTDVLLPKQGVSLKISAAADSAGLVRRMELDIWRFPPGEPRTKWTHTQHGSYELGRDSVVGIVRGVQGQQSQRYPAPAGSIIFQWAYIALLEQLTFRARALGVSTAEIPVYFFGTEGYVLPATVRFRPGTDSVAITLGQEEYRLVLNKYNRIESAIARTEEIRRVAPRRVFPADSTITQDLRCPEGALRKDLAAIRADSSVRQLLSLYPGAASAKKFRVLHNDADLAVCKELLDLFPPQGIVPQLVELGDVYMVVVVPPGQRAAVGIVSHDLSVAHFTWTVR